MTEKNTIEDKTFRWGMIGCGDVTEKKSGPAYQKVRGFSLAGVTRRNLNAANDYATRHNIPKVYSNVEALIQDPDIDAVYIATPPDSHKDIALLVALAGKACCIEKPLAPSFSDCEIICEAFRQNSIPLFVAYYRRSLPRFLKISEWLSQNLIGEVRHVSWQYHRPPSDVDKEKKRNWRTDKSVAFAGYFDDLASHGLDLFAFLFGEFTHVTGLSINQQGLYSSDDAVVGAWVHENNITGSGVWNFGSSLNMDKVLVTGSRGSIAFSIFGEENVSLFSGDISDSLFIENPEHIQYFHVQNMLHNLADNKPHPSTGETALHTAWVMDKMVGRI